MNYSKRQQELPEFRFCIRDGISFVVVAVGLNGVGSLVDMGCITIVESELSSFFAFWFFWGDSGEILEELGDISDASSRTHSGTDSSILLLIYS